MSLQLNRAALLGLVNDSVQAQALLHRVAKEVRDEARDNASQITDKTDAIVSQLGVDEQGLYADVGYARNHPGFYLWWWEVGNENHAARPHLRPALRPRL